MITIIEKGTKHKKKCEACGCLFSYEDEDIETHYTWLVPVYEYIKCPQCKNDILLRSFDELIDGEKEKDDEKED